MIELLFQVWIYFTDPALVQTHTHKIAHRHAHTHGYTCTGMLAHACPYTLIHTD